MSAAEVLAQVTALPPAERAQVVQQSLEQLDPDMLKLVERKLRRLQHPEVPASFWEGVEDMEDDRGVDMETALFETPPPEVVNRQH
jgi:hypothetical protein